MKIWVRCGDADDYHGYKSLLGVANYLFDKGVKSQLVPHVTFGFRSAEFRGNNYISLYHGNKQDDPVSSLTDYEISEINRYIRNKARNFGINYSG